MTTLYLHRRRLILTFLLLMLSEWLHLGWAYFTYVPSYVLISSAMFAGLGTSAAIFVVFFLPTLRCAVETVAAAFVVVRLIELAPLPSLLEDQDGASYGLLIFAVIYMAVYQIAYGQFWLKTRVRISYRLRSKFTTNASPDAVWRAVVPNNERPQDHYSGTFSEMAPVADAPGRFIFRSRTGPSTVLEQTFYNIESDEPNRFEHDVETVASLKGAPPQRSHWSMTLTPQGEKTRVEIEERLVAAAPSTVTLAWIDDLAGQISVAMRAKLEDRRDPTVLTHMRRAAGAVAP